MAESRYSLSAEHEGIICPPHELGGGGRISCSVLAWLLLCMSSIAPNSSQATTVRAFDTSSLVKHADTIVRAKAEASRSFWNPSRTRIYTETRLRVSTVLFETDRTAGSSVRRASTADEVTFEFVVVRQLGGSVGDVRMTVPGTVSFNDGDDVVLFLRRHEGFHTLVGMAQGCVTLQKIDGQLHAVTDLKGARLLSGAGAEVPRRKKAPIGWGDYRAHLDTVINARIGSEVGP